MSTPVPGDAVEAGRNGGGWRRTDRSLRIALIGWARLSSQAWEGSGYNLVASELARGLAMSGHEVFYLASGTQYRVFKRPQIVHREDWGGTHCYELINSPNASPGAFNFQNMRREMNSPDQARLVIDWLDKIRADVVHVHSAEGFSLDVLGAIEDIGGRRVIVTPHNYWFVCPQVDLLHEETRVCMDYQGGARCVGCLPDCNPARFQRKRKLGQSLEKIVGMKTANMMRGAAYGAVHAMRAGLKGRRWRLWNPPILNADSLKDPELAHGFEQTDPDAEGLIQHDFEFSPIPEPKPYDASPDDQNERFLTSDVHLKVVNEYGERRIAGIESLKRATLVTPPSDFLRKVHVEMGVEDAKTRWVRLGLPHFDQINRRARRSPYYDKRPWDPATATRPLRLAFLGTTRPNKGLQVLADAIPLLDRDVRQRCQFMIRAQGDDWAFRKRLAAYPEVSVWGGFDRYQLIAAGGEYDVGILTHIWFENSPLVLLENLHAGKFVITSRLGGPVDWIKPPMNGLFFAAGDPAGLAQRITELAVGDVTVPSAREIHEVTTLVSYPDYVYENERLYREVLGLGEGVKVVERGAGARV